MDIAQAIKEKRKEKSMSRKQLAEKAACKLSDIEKLESIPSQTASELKKILPHRVSLWRIAEALETTEANLIVKSFDEKDITPKNVPRPKQQLKNGKLMVGMLLDFLDEYRKKK